jgi:WD40 repeat protein
VAYIGPAGAQEDLDSDGSSSTEENEIELNEDSDNTETSCQPQYQQELVASAGLDFVVRIWDIKALVCLQVLTGHSEVS